MGLIFLPSVLRPHPHPGQVVCQCRWQHAVIYVKSTNITIEQVIPQSLQLRAQVTLASLG